MPAGFDAESQDDNNDGKGSSEATTFRAQLAEEELRAGKLPAQPAIAGVVVEFHVVEETTTSIATERLTNFNKLLLHLWIIQKLRFTFRMPPGERETES